MKSDRFTRLLRQLSLLTRQQRAQLAEALRSAIGLDKVCATIEQARSAPLCCPDCASHQHYRHGITRGLQRYRCRACGRTFSALTGTPLARLRHRARWLDYLKEMLESQKGSRRLERPPRRRGGVAHSRGISHEHDCILVARDRSGQTCAFVTGRAAVTVRQLHRHLRPVLDPDVLLVSDGHLAYRRFTREARIAHAFVNLRLGERVRGAIHVQNVNAYHRRFRSWLSRFHGVASRYLPNYLGWRWALDGKRIASPELLLRAIVSVFHT